MLVNRLPAETLKSKTSESCKCFAVLRNRCEKETFRKISDLLILQPVK